MKKRIYWLAAALLVVAAAGFFSGWHIYLHGERPRTVENITGEWFLRQYHAHNVDLETDDAWTVDFPTDDHDIYITVLFDAGGFGCIEMKHEGSRIVHASYYHWALADDTLVRSNEWENDEYRIEKLTRSELVLVIRRENLRGETYESTYYYTRHPLKELDSNANGRYRRS
ncbi:MAG: hypothetical protein NC250_07150 [Alistipes senegalensis]|nr:hypothetical protein [Bacteroides cellulosilyticus]MCM1352492.1 hypothetical protein [Alistipes senegalensis]